MLYAFTPPKIKDFCSDEKMVLTELMHTVIFRMNIFHKQVLAFRVDESKCGGRTNTCSHCKLW